MSFDTTFRDFQPADLDEVHALNERAVPHVSSLETSQLVALGGQASYFRVASTGDRVAAFLVGLETGADYDSVNYEFFSRNYDGFFYIDRIVVAEWARRRRIAWGFYVDFERFARLNQARYLCAEVNVRPPNDESLVFHERFGFEEVGQQDTSGGSKRVSLLVKRLGTSEGPR